MTVHKSFSPGAAKGWPELLLSRWALFYFLILETVLGRRKKRFRGWVNVGFPYLWHLFVDLATHCLGEPDGARALRPGW